MESDGLHHRSSSSRQPDDGAVPSSPAASLHENHAKMAEKTIPSPPPASAPESLGGCFDCNICLETPNDPVVTLCGHLFCWACLYRWLRVHAQSNECPVCKAGVEEDKVVPLYGRGKASSDPRQKPVPGADVPNRPSGRRAEPIRHGRPDTGFGMFPGAGGPFAAPQFGGFTVSAGFGLFPALFGWHFHASPGLHPGSMPAFAQGHAQGQHPRNMGADEQNAFLSRLLFALGIFVMMAIIFS